MIRRGFVALLAGICLAGLAEPVEAQLGILTSAIGTGHVVRADGGAAEWRIGQTLLQGDQVMTSADSYAMLFFVSGLGAADIQFEGAIVVEIDQNTTVEIRRGSGRRAPIDVHVVQGRVRAFFDAGEHKDYILLSTPLGELQVTGSVIYAAHNTAGFPGTVLGSLDSDCVARIVGGGEVVLSRLQKVVLKPGAEARLAGITLADTASWESMPDLNLAAAMAQRGGVQLGYAGKIWVGEYIVGSERLEDVAEEAAGNIPSQEPELVATAATTTARTAETTPRETRPRLRASTSGRSAGAGEEGVVRDSQPASSQPPTLVPEWSPHAWPQGSASLRSAGLGRSATNSSARLNPSAVRP